MEYGRTSHRLCSTASSGGRCLAEGTAGDA
jgi:hypothetical protein